MLHIKQNLYIMKNFYFLIITLFLGLSKVPLYAEQIITTKPETNVYAFLTPLALIFILLEICLCAWYKKQYITFSEAVANFGTALGNQTSNVLVAAAVYVVYGYLYSNYRILTIPLNPLTFIVLLLSIDFIFYWVHRWGHHINIMWAAHSPHHSAQEMNFFVALRASVTQRLFSFLFFFPLTIIGFSPFDIYMMTGIHLFISFLHHTELIRNLGIIEKIFTTPSHHRVHHGINFKYLDRNFGEFLIIWDKLFGTFEQENEQVVYGMYFAPKSYNPITINFHYYLSLFNTAMAAPYFIDKIKIWFMPLTWVPRGLPPKPPLIETTLQNQQKYSPTMFKNAKPYLIVHVILGTLLMMMIIKDNSVWTTQQRWIGAALLWFCIINWSGILEAKKWLPTAETIRVIITTYAVAIFCNLSYTNPILWLLIAIAASSIAYIQIYFKKTTLKIKNNPLTL